MVEAALKAFGLDTDVYTSSLFGSGLIHNTYIIKDKEGAPAYILQKVNHFVFKKPEDIAHNLKLMGSYISHFHPDYLFTQPHATLKGEDYYYTPEEGYFRLFEFIKGTHTADVCRTALQAYEAAKQFGKFTAVFSGLRTDMLRYTIPDFHNLSFRYRQFEDALQHGNTERINTSFEEINFIISNKNILVEFENIKKDPGFKIRVTHHDTKINNVLLDEDSKGVAVIDLDTVMPGYFISDAGDMMRTYLSPANEEEKDFSKIFIRPEFFKAIAEGYLSEMKNELSATEKQHFVYSGKFMTYMQALRFLTDHLNNDTYYGAKYDGHNLVRAGNQIALLRCILQSEDQLNNTVESLL